MKLSEDLTKRGLIKDKTFDDVAWLDKPRKFYLGIDAASADSLTIGNLAVILLARRFIEADWKAVMLAGGATSLVGDPGGKDEERALADKSTVAANIKVVKTQIEKVLAGAPHEVVNNADWLDNLKYLDFLRDTGKHYPVSDLLQRDFVATRLAEHGSGISYAEFSYSLLQGYDFWHLYKSKGVELQIGASDQWGNMLSGVPLVRKKEGKEVHAMCMPLVVNQLTGKKFGKSEEGAVWLDPARTSPTQFYQFWVNVDDANVGDYLKIFTFLSLDEIAKTMEYHVSSPEERKAQLLLAREVTELVHGKEETHTAKVVTDVLTGKTPIASVGEGVLAQVRKEIPAEKAKGGTPLVDVLVSTGLASSKTEARRLIGEGAVQLNTQKITDENHKLTETSLLKRGKAFKDSALIELKN